MSPWSTQDLARALGSPPVHTGPESEFVGVAIDSRKVQPQNIFLCLKGERTDGHLYIEAALSAGAKALVVEESFLAAGGLGLPDPGSATVFSVEDGLLALQDLARYYRDRRPDLCVLGVTGSNGKTSTKEMLFGLLSEIFLRTPWETATSQEAQTKSKAPPAAFAGQRRENEYKKNKINIFATEGNLNNHIGLPLSLLSIPKECRYAVLEMGMNHAGEISFLSRIARPNHAFVSSISGAHMEFFSSVEEIARAKLEILDGITNVSKEQEHENGEGALEEQNGALSCSKKSIFSWPKEAPLQEEVKRLCQKKGLHLLLSESAEALLQKGLCKVSTAGLEIHFQNYIIKNPNYFSPVMAANLLACLEFLSALGFAKDALISAAEKVRPLTPGRFSVHRRNRKDKEDQLIVDDSYNANPASFAAALLALREILPQGRLALLAGEMAELGEGAAESHYAIGGLAARLGFAFLGLAGEKHILEMQRGFEETPGKDSKKGHPKNNAYLEKENKEKIEADHTASKQANPFGDLKRVPPPFDPADAPQTIQQPNSQNLLESLSDLPEEFLSSFDGILIKGSRSLKMERMLELFSCKKDSPLRDSS